MIALSFIIQILLIGSARSFSSENVLDVDVVFDSCMEFAESSYSCLTAGCVWCSAAAIDDNGLSKSYKNNKNNKNAELQKTTTTTKSEIESACVKRGNLNYARKNLGKNATCEEPNSDPSTTQEEEDKKIKNKSNASPTLVLDDASSIITSNLLRGGNSNSNSNSNSNINSDNTIKDDKTVVGTTSTYAPTWKAIVDCYIPGAYNTDTSSPIYVKFYDAKHNFIGGHWGHYGSYKCWKYDTAWSINTWYVPKYIYIKIYGYDAYLIDNFVVKRNNIFVASNTGNWCLSKDYYDYRANGWGKYGIYRCYSEIRFTIHY